MNKPIFFITLLLLLTANGLFAQSDACPSAIDNNGSVAWIEPAIPDVEDTVTIYYDVTKDTGCDILVGDEGPMYIWTWNPAQVDEKLGSWTSSATTAQMEKFDDNIWMFKMIPTEFYEVTPEEVYEKGICFLVKKADGGTGGDCSSGGGDFKTSDVFIPVPAPAVPEKKVFSFPATVSGDTLAIGTDDVITLFYDNKVEKKETILNLEEVWVYFRVEGDDGNDYAVSTLFQIGLNPALQMKNEGNGLFSMGIIPDDFLAEVLPAGVRAHRFRLQFLRWPFLNTDDAVDGEFYFTYRCQD